MMSEKLRAGQNVTFMFMNKRADQNATAVYRFYSKDGEVDMTGSFMSSQSNLYSHVFLTLHNKIFF